MNCTDPLYEVREDGDFVVAVRCLGRREVVVRCDVRSCGLLAWNEGLLATSRGRKEGCEKDELRRRKGF
jgi:hypothetical protein